MSEVSALCPLRTWFPVCLFVCLFLWVRGRQTERGRVTAPFKWFQLSPTEWEATASCVCTQRSPFVLKKNNWAFHRDSHNLAVALKDVHTHKHRDPSQSLSQYLSPVSNTKVGCETMLLVPLLLTLSVLWSWRWWGFCNVDNSLNTKLILLCVLGGCDHNWHNNHDWFLLLLCMEWQIVSTSFNPPLLALAMQGADVHCTPKFNFQPVFWYETKTSWPPTPKTYTHSQQWRMQPCGYRPSCSVKQSIIPDFCSLWFLFKLESFIFLCAKNSQEPGENTLSKAQCFVVVAI